MPVRYSAIARLGSQCPQAILADRALTKLWPEQPCPTCRAIPAIVGVEPDVTECPTYPPVCPDCGKAITVVYLICEGAADIAAAL